MGFEIPTVIDALGAQFSDAQLMFAPGCSVEDLDRSGIAEAVEAASEADVAIVVVGDRAGLFGRGTVGEGNDVESLELPGVQRELVEAVVATGTPVVMVLLTGRPYAIDWALDGEQAPRAVLQAFFPGEEGAPGDRVDPRGRDRPQRSSAGLAAPVGGIAAVLLSASDPGRTERDHQREQRPRPAVRLRAVLHLLLALRPHVQPHAPTDDAFQVSVRRVATTESRAGADVVQLYARDVYASVTRPVAQLLGYARVFLEAGQEAVVELRRAEPRAWRSPRRGGERIVEPGTILLWVGPSCADRETAGEVELTGPRMS